MTVIDATHDPLARIGECAGASTARTGNDRSRAVACIERGHHGVMEHATATLRVEGISRACANQLVRHRIGMSFVQESQRYTKVDVSSDWYVEPPEVAALGMRDPYASAMCLWLSGKLEEVACDG